MNRRQPSPDAGPGDRRAAIVRLLLVILALFFAPVAAPAGEALVAVATNFSETMLRLRDEFAERGPHRVAVATGSTGKLYAQVLNGAPYDALLAADQERPRRLVAAGLAVAGTRFVYATGRLCLWSRDGDRLARRGFEVLERGEFRKLAIANPSLAPYGAAAVQVLETLGLYDALRDRLVLGENAGQAQAMVATGNAELGLVARAQLLRPGGGGEHCLPVPPQWHAPIRQDAVLLEHGRDNDAARAFLTWLGSDAARATIAAFGYGLE